MKGLLFVAVSISIYGFNVFGMDSRASLDKKISEWSEDVDILLGSRTIVESGKGKGYSEALEHIKTFDTAVLKEALYDEIGNDPHAQNAFGLFHSYKLFKLIKLIDHPGRESVNMTADNLAKFREILIVTASIIKHFEDETPNAKKYLGKIIKIVGGHPEEIRSTELKYPQFCFEMMMCAHLDVANNTAMWPCSITSSTAAFAQACKCVCEGIYGGSNWDEKKEKEEKNILFYLSDRSEDDGGLCNLRNIWPNW